MEDKDTLEGKRYLRAKKNVEKVKEVYIAYYSICFCNANH